MLPSLLLVLPVVLAATSVIVFALKLGIGPTPSSARAVRAMLELLPEELEGEVHELGAGWGSVAFALADGLPRARVVAWEQSWVPWLFCRVRQAARRRSNLWVRRGDFFAHDFRGASAVTCYLFTGAMRRLAEKLASELRPGALVVSHTFSLPGWQADRTIVLDDLYRSPVYRYTQRPTPP